MKHRKAQEGSILILALWTLVFLGALAVAVGAYVGGGLRLAERQKRATAAYYLARAGVERSLMEVLADTNAWDSVDEPWRENDNAFENVELGDGIFSVWHESPADVSTVFSSSAQVVTNYGLVDEESKISINRASVPLLSALFEVAGALDPSSAGRLAEAIADWRDADDEVLTGGAETGYYQSLSQPYESRNAAFGSVQELRLVKGMDDAIFARLAPYVTVHGMGRVNLNTAGSMVLRSLALSCAGRDRTVADSVAGKLLAYRESGGALEDAGTASIHRELSQSTGLSGQESRVLSGMLKAATVRSSCFSGIAAGRLDDAPMWDSRIGFVVNRSRQVVVVSRTLD